MTVNKELYERYKAMKAAKLAAAQKNETEKPKTGFGALSQTEKSIKEEQVSYETSSETPQQTTQTTPACATEQMFIQNDIPQPPLNETPVANSTVQSNENNLKKFALIGYPLGHSLSKYIHEAGFKSIGINATYEILETKPEDLSERIKYLRSNGYTGFNVTIPLKLPVTMFLDEVDASANTVNAINTAYIDPQTHFIKGFNTDAAGFKNAIPNDISLFGKTVGILGTGGAARAAICALATYQVKEMKIYTRNVANSIEFMEYLRKTFPKIEFNSYQIDRIRDLSKINFLVNATPIGMQGHASGYTPVEEQELQTLPADAVVYDVIYNPKKTLFIKLAQKHNYRTITGMDMLIYQAVEAQKIWTGRVPDFKDMKIAALENL